MSGSTTTGLTGAGQFQVKNGEIIGPSGSVFMARGINVSDSQMGDANQILADFPGLNFIRLNVVSYDSPATYSTFINTMTSHGVVVELEDHTSSDGSDEGGSRGAAFTGSELTNELNWYTSIASAYASNPYVWFGTDNEPPNAGLSPWQQETYNAIRSTGNSNPILIELPGGAYPGNQTVTSYGMDPTVYDAMSNIIADVHFYGWSSLGNTNQQVVNATLTDLVQGAKTIPSLDGNVPVILGEYGPSTDGQTPDPDANQIIQAAQNSSQIAGTDGALAFSWGAGGADSLTDAQGNLTSYGQEVAQWIAASANGANGSGEAPLTVLDTTTKQTLTPAAVPYTGPVSGIQDQYVNITTDSLNISTTTPNWFINSGSGNDAINVSAGGGNNILDGGSGSNFLTGGRGDDTFYLDARNPTTPTLSTIANFHSGDSATIWGVSPTDFTMLELNNQGAPGYTGLDLVFTAPGHVVTSFVLAGYTSTELTNGQLTTSYGTTPNLTDLPGSQYLTIHAT